MVCSLVWDPNHLDQVESIPGAPLFITVDMVSSAVGKMKTVKAAGPSGIIAEIIKAAGEPVYNSYLNLPILLYLRIASLLIGKTAS